MASEPVVASPELPAQVSEAAYRAFLRLWAFFTIDESLTDAAIHSDDVERAYGVRTHLRDDWDRLHPRVRSWIIESEDWWRQVAAAWSPTAKSDERRRAQLRRYFAPRFVALSRLWRGGSEPRPPQR